MSQPDSRIADVPFQTELGASFGRYAQKVILDRAIPDVRDGLKPVQRRIIYAMHEAGNTHDKPYRKSAKTVGDVMGNYHPHGDSAIYEALVRMAQPWKMRYPLIDGHGNFGSMDDDPAAAMRYTEARLSALAAELMRDIDKDTVAWKPNFDEKELEPVVLPAGFLNLLINGSSGVSAGFATDIPSHNLGEVINATVARLDDPEIGLERLMRLLPGPDFPTGGILMGADGLREAYETGRGKVVLRGRHTIETLKDGRQLLVFNEIPYNVIKAELVRQIDEMRLAREVIGMNDVRDESDRNGLRFVIELAKGADADGVLAYLFKKSDLQINYHFNMVSIARNTPVQLGLVAILDAFIAHRRRVVLRRSAHDLARREKRLHEVEGLIRAVDILDEVIATIRRSKDRGDARNNLVVMGFSEVQADAILELRLHRLTNLELLDLRGEAAELSKTIDALRKILNEPAERDRVVRLELIAIRDRFADPRRTTIEAEVAKLDVDVKVTVKDQDVVIGVTRAGWIKQSSLASFTATGGTRKASGVRPGDRMLSLIHTRTTHHLLAFSHTGQCYPIPVHQVPEARWADVGTALVNVCGISRDEELVDILARADFPENRYLLFITRDGLVKMTALSEFASSRSSGLLAMKIGEGDALARVVETDGKGELLLMTEDGQGIRFDLEEVSVQGRAARGVTAMKVETGDRIVDAVLFPPSDTAEVVVVTRAGRAKRTPLEQFPKQKRGGKGVRFIVQRIQNKHLCTALMVAEPGMRLSIVDALGHEQMLPLAEVVEGRRDGNAMPLPGLPDSTSIATVELLPGDVVH
jgi:topoisomerase-4 subunit A